MRAIIKKEFKTYFTGINGYVFLGFFVFITAIFFGATNVDGMDPFYASTMSSTIIMFLILVPVLTMRLFAEEARQKTDQLLFTSPLTVGQIVIGKFLAAFLLFGLSLGITLLFPLILSRYGEIPWAQTISAFVGFSLLGGAFIAVGLFISSLTESQVVAAVASFASLFVFFLIDWVVASAPTSRLSSVIFLTGIVLMVAGVMYNSTKSMVMTAVIVILGALIITVTYLVNDLLFDGVIYSVLTWFSVLSRLTYFLNGILNLSDIIYYLTFVVAFVYLTVNTIEKRRWR